MQHSTPVFIVIALGVVCMPQTKPQTDKDAYKENTKTLEKYYQQALEAAFGDFSQSLYVQLADTFDSENFVFSPLSLHSALTLMYLGTKDNSTTQEQLGGAMGIVSSPQLLKSSYNKIIQTYKDQKSFLYGNHIWVGKGFNLKTDYKDIVSSQFNSELSDIDFGKIEAVEEVNQWISKLTKGKIQDIVDSFFPDTKLFIANALYFNEKWLNSFDDTNLDGKLIEEYFHTEKGELKVPMVRQISNKIVYGEINTPNSLLEVVTIPYKNDHFEMQIILPKNFKGLKILEDEMKVNENQDDKRSFNLFKTLKNESFENIEDVSLKIPIFKVHSKFDAKEALQNLGARKVFTSEAELDKIASGGPFGVGKVAHEALVEVNKEGTEGAAATGLEIVPLSANFGIQKNIVVDRPFIFIVQDRLNNIPVLVGKVKNPST